MTLESREYFNWRCVSLSAVGALCLDPGPVGLSAVGALVQSLGLPVRGDAGALGAYLLEELEKCHHVVTALTVRR